MKVILYSSISICVIMGAVFYVWSISRLPSDMEMYIFDTKGKPSVFIRTPNDTRILIDGGANGDIVRYITSIVPFYSRRIDKVIVTSDDPNNVTGLIDIISRYKVGSIIIPKITAKQLNIGSSTDQIYETFVETIDVSKIPIKEVMAGDDLILDYKNNQLRANILFPVSTTTDMKEFKYSKASPPELIMRIYYGRTSFLFMGDTSLKIQKYIANSASTSMSVSNEVADGTDLHSDVLIVPHGISATFLSANLINKVKPKFVIYSQTIPKGNSNAKNNKADPFYMILDSNRFNLKQKSTITVLSDGKSVKVI